MRRWFDIYADNSNSNWRYDPFDGMSHFWCGMPSKQQLDSWQNFAQNLFVKIATYTPGANPDFDCGGGGPTFANPDRDYTIVQTFVRYDVNTFFAPVYPTANLT